MESRKVNAASAKIFVTIPNDHFGSIVVKNDPIMNCGGYIHDEDHSEWFTYTGSGGKYLDQQFNNMKLKCIFGPLTF